MDRQKLKVRRPCEAGALPHSGDLACLEYCRVARHMGRMTSFKYVVAFGEEETRWRVLG